jgi:hypothetical protein
VNAVHEENKNEESPGIFSSVHQMMDEHDYNDHKERSKQLNPVKMGPLVDFVKKEVSQPVVTVPDEKIFNGREREGRVVRKLMKPVQVASGVKRLPDIGGVNSSSDNRQSQE